jgi:beta-1,4-mannosyl-glycoprotein beta-1,4-N-acetylglucosaminyltransferase
MLPRRFQTPMITDAFMFFNELELLELRLHELKSVVDRFILVEARETFTCRPKPLHYYDNRARFKRFWDRIDHQVIERFPVRNDAWQAEQHQRERALVAFGDGDPDDLIICSDVDEIPRADALTPDIARSGPVVLAQPNYYLYLNCRNLTDRVHKMALVARRRDIQHSLTEYRAMTLPTVPNGGWHFSYLGGLQRVQAKMAAYSHQELNVGHFITQKNYERALRAGCLHYNAEHRIEWVPVDASFPKHVLEQPEAYAHLLAPPGLIGSSRADLFVLRVNHRLVHFRERVRRRLRREIKQRFG